MKAVCSGLFVSIFKVNMIRYNSTFYKGQMPSPVISEYSRLSLSWPRLSWITAYLEVKIWSLFKHENLTTGNKILWKREIAPKEQFLFSTIFSKYL